MGEAIRQFDVRNEDLLSYDAQGIAPLHSCAGTTVAFGRIQPGCSGMQGISSEGCEDNAVVLSGILSYPTAPGQEVFVSKGSWVVTRPGEICGYCNRSARPVTLFIFRPRARGPARESGAGPRVFTPAGPPNAVRLPAYQTETSRGEVLSLHPGENAALSLVPFGAALVTGGRVMVLAGREKISLDEGEGIAFTGTAVEFVGVGGLSTVAVFSTAR